MRAKHIFPAIVILVAMAVLAVPAAASHQVTFMNTCNQDVWINLQGGPQGTCDNNGKACSGCEVCGYDSFSNPIICNTSAVTGNDTPICCPGSNTDRLYCNTGESCLPDACCPGVIPSGGTSYNCPQGGNYSTTLCGNATMSQAEIDALSGYNNASLGLHRIACNGSLIAGGGFKLDASTGSQTYTFPTAWNGGFFPRTGCSFDANGFGNCDTGNCIDLLNRGLFQCGGAGSAAPVTKAEINFDGGTPVTDSYDISYVNGFNVAMLFTPTQYNPSYVGKNQCTVGGCPVNLSSFSSPKVPSWNMLKYTSVSNFIGIWDTGDYYYNTHNMTGDPHTGPNIANWTIFYGYSCPISEGYVNDSSISCADVPAGKTCKTCAGQNNNLYPFNQPGALPNSANLFFDTCPNAYAYTYNDTAALIACEGNVSYPTNYRITVSCDGTPGPTTPTVSGIAPTSGPLAGGTVVTITGTGFSSPATVRFGTTSSLNPQVISGTQINATSPAHIAGVVNITVTTSLGTSATSPDDRFTYLAAPAFASIVSQGPWNRNTTVNYTIKGTNFQPGNTVLTFQNRSGLFLNGTDAGITSLNATTITGTIHIPFNAPVGAWNISIATAGGKIWKDSAFTVQGLPNPIFTSVTPATAWVRNTTVNYTIKGTNFQPGNTAITFQNRSGLFLNGSNAGVTSLNATTITGTIHIPFDAPVGAWNVSIATVDGGRIWKDSAFTVQSFQTPIFTSVTPATAWVRNSTVNYTIKGTNFQPGNTAITFQNRSGLFLNGSNAGVTSFNATTISGTIHIPFDAPVGAWNISIATVDGGRIWKDFAFTVQSFPKPTVTTITASGLYYRNTTINYTITGTGFQPEKTTVLFRNKTGQNLNATPVNSGVKMVTPTTISGTILIPNNAPTGTPYNITVTTIDGGTGTKESAFSVIPQPAPVISTFTPSTGSKNTTILFTITGQNFETGGGYTNITIQNAVIGGNMYGAVTSISPTRITGTFTIPPNADGGSHDLMVRTVDGGTTIRQNALVIDNLPLPVITSINQTSGFRNSTVIFDIKGNYFLPNGGTFVRLNSTAAVPIYGVLSSVTATDAIGTFTIPYNAGTGYYRLDLVTVSGGPASKPNAFAVSPQPRPLITTTTPTQSYRNRTFFMTVTGSNFQAGSGTSVFLTHPTGNVNITMGLTSLTPVRLNGTITVPADAPTTPLWKLNVSTIDGGVATKSAAIAIQSYPAPTFTSITPASGLNNTVVAFTVRGTNFQTPGTNVTFWNKTGNAVLDPTILSVSSTQVAGTVSIPSNANQSWYVNISTVDGGLVSKVNVFRVT
jgi:hypothetical protein